MCNVYMAYVWRTYDMWHSFYHLDWLCRKGKVYWVYWLTDWLMYSFIDWSTSWASQVREENKVIKLFNKELRRTGITWFERENVPSSIIHPVRLHACLRVGANVYRVIMNTSRHDVSMDIYFIIYLFILPLSIDHKNVIFIFCAATHPCDVSFVHR